MLTRRLNSRFLIALLTGLLSFVTNASEPTKFVHYAVNDQSAYGIVNGDQITPIRGDLFGRYETSDQTLSLNDVRLLPATYPSKIIAVGLNYGSHFFSSRGEYPKLFSKVPSSITGDGQPVWLYPDSTNLHYEGELVVVIGKTAKNITREEATDYIFGVTAGNDMTDRSWQSQDLQWLRAKGADSFAPVSPWIVSGLDYNDLLVETRVNGKTVQSERTRNLLFTVDEIVSYTSQYVTLNPGDLIFTGTPGKTHALSVGDVVEVSVESVGRVTNTITNKQR